MQSHKPLEIGEREVSQTNFYKDHGNGRGTGSATLYRVDNQAPIYRSGNGRGNCNYYDHILWNEDFNKSMEPNQGNWEFMGIWEFIK
jgi:hypothetical protein